MEEKSKLYILSRGEKSLTLLRIFKNEGTEISEFVEALKPIQQVKRIVLETRNQNEAHCFIVGDNIPETEIRKIVENIAKKNDYTIKFVALSEKQFNEMVQAGIYDLKEKVIWKR
jgi:NAD kinase